MTRRLAVRPGEVIDRSDVRRFIWNGELLAGYGMDAEGVISELLKLVPVP